MSEQPDEDQRHDPTVDRDDFTGIPEAPEFDEDRTEAQRLWDEHDPAEWTGMRDDDEDGS